ncbi:MAG: DUF3793 family protein [Clostridia bacterium]|nr:DUF3793 family protein [Clostridia bacterium]
MSDEMIVKHCSPTLAGLKTGNMFTCFFRNKEEMNESIRNWNRILVKKGLRIIPLKYRNSRGLIYIYRPRKLSEDLGHHTAGNILESLGYSTNDAVRCIVHLMKRLNECEEFPHEIGLFLGYPPEDVQGFIDNNAMDAKYVGCWKVYSDEDEAKKTFAKYKKCTDVYARKLRQGRSIEKLTVAG